MLKLGENMTIESNQTLILSFSFSFSEKLARHRFLSFAEEPDIDSFFQLKSQTLILVVLYICYLYYIGVTPYMELLSIFNYYYFFDCRREKKKKIITIFFLFFFSYFLNFRHFFYLIQDNLNKYVCKVPTQKLESYPFLPTPHPQEFIFVK